MKKMLLSFFVVFALMMASVNASGLCNSNLNNTPCNITSSTTFEQVLINNTGEQMSYINLDSVDLSIDFNGSELIFTKINFFADGYNDHIVNVVLNSYGLTPNASFDDYALINIFANDETPDFDNFSIIDSELKDFVGDGIFILDNKNLSGLVILRDTFSGLNFGFNLVPDNNFVSDLYVDGNTFSNMVNGCGQVGDGDNINFLNNVCENSGWGIDTLGDASNVLYQYNNMSNLGSAIYISCNLYGTECVGVSVLYNNLENVGVGLYARNVVDGLINHNNLNTDTRIYLRSFQGEVSYNNLTNGDIGTTDALIILLSDINFSHNYLFNLTNDYGEMAYIYGSTTGVFEFNTFEAVNPASEVFKIANANLLFDTNDFDTDVSISGGTNVFSGNTFRHNVVDSVVGTKFCSDTPNFYVGGVYSGVNIGNCPIYSEFSTTTDFSSVSDWSNVALDLNNSFGLIEFDAVNLSGLEEVDLDTAVEITQDSISVSGLSALDTSATLTFKNVSASDVDSIIVKKDGVVCSTCSNQAYNPSTLEFSVDVSGFSTYTLDYYVVSYEAEDLSKIAIDGLGKAGVFIVSVMSLLVIAFLYALFEAKYKKVKYK